LTIDLRRNLEVSKRNSALYAKKLRQVGITLALAAYKTLIDSTVVKNQEYHGAVFSALWLQVSVT
jgi:hypothetical protein